MDPHIQQIQTLSGLCLGLFFMFILVFVLFIIYFGLYVREKSKFVPLKIKKGLPITGANPSWKYECELCSDRTYTTISDLDGELTRACRECSSLYFDSSELS